MKKEVLISLALIVLLVFFAGCNEELTNEDLQKIPEAKEFLEKYPDALVKTSYFSVDKFKTMIAYAPFDCKTIPENSYFKIMLVSENATLYIYAEEESLSVECTHWDGGDECFSIEDCDDNDSSTKSICSGKPKKCSFELKTCSEQKGDKCIGDEKCPKPFIKSADSKACCPVKCTGEEITDHCKDVLCMENEKCDNGHCRLKTCDEFNGVNCEENEYCEQAFISSLDSERCCPVACSETDPCADTECASHLKCIGGKCVLKNCEERSGYICSAGEACAEGFISALDSDKCCPESCRQACGSSFCLSNQKCINNSCRDFTCAELGGMVCPGTTECNAQLQESFDEENCCVGNCVYPEVEASAFDIEIEGLELLDETPCDGLISLVAKFRNKGEKIDLTESGEYVNFEIYLNGDLVANNLSKRIIEENELLEMEVSEVSTGRSFTVSVFADSENDVEESNESNNSEIFSVGTELDLFAENLTVTESGGELLLCATTKISGESYAAPAVWVGFYLNNSLKLEERIDSMCVAETNSSEKCVSIPLEDFKTGENEFKVIVDSASLVSESNELNNNATTTITIEGPECAVETQTTDCNDEKDFTADTCVNETCVNEFIEGTDCGQSYSNGALNNLVALGCFGIASLECTQAQTGFGMQNYNSTFSVEEKQGDLCTTKWTIDEILVQESYFDAGMTSSCVHSISELEGASQDWPLPELSAASIVMALHNQANPAFCSGTLTDRANEPCDSLCGYKGYGFGVCMTDEAKSTYQECSSQDEEYLGNVPACKEGENYYPCCCAQTEEDMLLPVSDWDLWTTGDLRIGKDQFSELQSADCYDWQNIYFTLHNSGTETLDNIVFDVYIDGVKQENLAFFDRQLRRVGVDWSEAQLMPPGEHLVSCHALTMWESVNGKTVKVVIDADQEYNEMNENNNTIETTFSNEMMDLYYSSYDISYGRLYIKLARDKIIHECPPIEFELYVDGVQRDPIFYGFEEGALEESIGAREVSPGEHEVRLVIDSNNTVPESNESNNDVTFTITVEDTQ